MALTRLLILLIITVVSAYKHVHNPLLTTEQEVNTALYSASPSSMVDGDVMLRARYTGHVNHDPLKRLRMVHDEDPSSPPVNYDAISTDGDGDTHMRSVFQSALHEYRRQPANMSSRQFFSEESWRARRWYYAKRRRMRMYRHFNWTWDTSEVVKYPTVNRSIHAAAANALFRRAFGDRIRTVHDILKTDIAHYSKRYGMTRATIGTAVFAAKRILIVDDKNGPSVDVGRHFYDGEVGIAVTTKLPDNPYYYANDDSTTLRKDMIKEYMHHAMFTVTVLVEGKRRTFTVSSPRQYGLGLFNNPADEADDTLPRLFRRNNAQPSIIMRPRLPVHAKITKTVRRDYNDNVRSWMVITSNYALFPWSNYDGGDGVYTIDLQRVIEYGRHLLIVLHEWKVGALFTEYSKSQMYLRSPRNLVYCGEFIHIVLNLGYHVPLSAASLKAVYRFDDAMIADIRAKIEKPSVYKWVKTRNTWPPRDNDGNMQRKFPNGLHDPDMLGLGDYLNQGIHLYMHLVPLRFFGDNEAAPEPLYKVLGIEPEPFRAAATDDDDDGAGSWVMDPALVMPVWSTTDVLQRAAAFYAGLPTLAAKFYSHSQIVGRQYTALYSANWEMVLQEMNEAYSGDGERVNYLAFLRALLLPKSVIRVLASLPISEADRDMLRTNGIGRMRLHFLRKAGLATPENQRYLLQHPVMPQHMAIFAGATKTNGISPLPKHARRALRMIGGLVKLLRNKFTSKRMLAHAMLSYMTRERGDGAVSVMPPHLLSNLARTFQLSSQHKQYQHIVQLEAIGVALDKSLVIDHHERAKQIKKNEEYRKRAEKPKNWEAAFQTSYCDTDFVERGGTDERQLQKHPLFPHSTRPVVAVIGTGVAGLTAASELSGKGCNVVLVEARDRIGGRVYTKDGVEYGTPTIGPSAWIRNPLLAAIFKQNQTFLYDMLAFNRTDYMGVCTPDGDGGCRHTYAHHQFKKLSQFLHTLRKQYYRMFFRDRNMYNTIDSAFRKIRAQRIMKDRVAFMAWRKYVLPYGGYGARISYRNVLTNDARLHKLHLEDTRVHNHPEGNMLPLNIIARRLRKKHNVKFLMSHELQSFGRCKSGARVVSRYGTKLPSIRNASHNNNGRPRYRGYWCEAVIRNRTEPLLYDALVSSLPLGVVKARFDSLFSNSLQQPNIQQRRRLLRRLASGNVVKLIVHLKEPLPKDYAFRSNTDIVGDQLWVFPENHPKQLGVIVAGHLGEVMVTMYSSRRKLYLARRLKIRLRSIRRIETFSWAKDPYALGSQPYFKSGSRLADMAIVSQSHNDRVYFIGDWTSHDDYGTVVGAYESAYRVAATLAAPQLMSVKQKIRRDKVTRYPVLHFFAGNPMTRDTQGRYKPDHSGAVANPFLRAGHLGVSDDAYELTDVSKRTYGWMPLVREGSAGNLFASMIRRSERVQGKVGNDIIAFKDAIESPEGYTICSMVLPLVRDHVCSTADCGVRLMEKQYMESRRYRGSENALRDMFYAFPVTKRARNSIDTPWWKSWGHDTFNCITYPLKQWGLRFDRMPQEHFTVLTRAEVKEFSTSGSSTQFGYYLADFNRAMCQCYKRGKPRICGECAKQQQKFCDIRQLKNAIRLHRRKSKARKSRSAAHSERMNKRWRKRRANKIAASFRHSTGKRPPAKPTNL